MATRHGGLRAPVADHPADCDDRSGLDGPGRLFGVASLRRRWKIVRFCTVALLILGLIFEFIKPIGYTASTQLLIYNRELHPGPEPVIFPGPADMPLVENTIEIFRSRGVLARVIEVLNLTQDAEFASESVVPVRLLRRWIFGSGGETSDDGRMRFEQTVESVQRRLAVARVGTSHTILVSFTSADPSKAARIANEVARTAFEFLTNTDRGAARATLMRERLRGLGPSVYVISAADPPIFADGPRRSVIVVAASVIGFGVGSMLALLLDFFDRSIRTSCQVEYFLGMECFGVIPYLHPPWLIWRPHASFCDALRRTAMVIHATRGLRTIGVTSGASGEGVTSVVAGLAQLSARSGKRALIVDAGRRGGAPSWIAAGNRLHGWTRLPGPAGLLGAGVLRDESSGLDVLSAADPTAVVRDVAWSTYLDEVLRETTISYDLVIVDLPSLASGPDVRMIAPKLDGVLLVVKWGGIDAELIERRLNLAGAARANFIGAILNMADKKLIGLYGDKLAGAEARLASGRFIIEAAEPASRADEARA